MVEPSGIYFRYYGCAAGKGKRACSTELERIPFADMTCADAMKSVAKLIEKSHDEVKDKPFELELACICAANDNEIFAVSDEVRQAAQTAAIAEIEAEEEDDDDE
jgi:20S proteasome subunit alpha 7